ncbi:aspartyl/asparaginyl beta-hydroxylase domain-containing protein [Gilvimarinus xylanilyticus]|uniref:Aspartyl/asparaginyl beta-hydroxylase domain-containing protein n=1 Tax=Gilvimarinus xylanilyticus TaxID=2944139 RepID=A0A9X2HWU6_9GAMM|nr:aspartyl/asparaginyl beta-hydroxylase domain-containing protein [Gilvimarinus xylanilyticus]MCP8898509.1 aspartyl/asparaginyl beta-hydroxylase domain-containing protein [Gilvimarinus xylanilyticus]
MGVILTCIAIYIGCIAFVRTRNRVTFPLSRQMTDFSTFMVPFNLPAYGLSKVPTTPRVSKEHFPELDVIEQNWEVIRDEALALYQGGKITTKDDLPASSFYKDNRWTSFYLKLYDHDIPSARELAPKTMELLDQVPYLNLALFAVLNPGKKLNQHHDPFAYTLRYSLGLSTPNSEKCGLQIDDFHYPWRDGDSIIFDETYLHSAYNDTETPRVILMTDIDRPLKLGFVQKGYWYFGRFFNGLFKIDNVDASNSGIGNKLGQGLLGYQRFLKSVKKKNRTFYYTAKWVVIGGLLLLIGSRLV